VDDLELNRLEHRASRGDRRIDLTQKEFALLEYLMRHPGRPLTRAMILDNVWGLDFDPTTNVVDVYVNYLRKKIDQGAERKLIHTVRNVGYCIRGEERAAADAGPPPSAGPASRSRRSPRNGNSKTRRF
jgi:DNA-binding response OmpR family regulator